VIPWALILALASACPDGCVDKEDARITALTFRTQAETWQIAHQGALDKLAVRTPTVAVQLQMPDVPENQRESHTIWDWFTVATCGAVVGAVAALLLTR
jgi:hypothetical protein